MGKAASCAYHLGPADMNSAHQDPYAVCCKPSPFSITVRFFMVEPCRSPAIPVVPDQSIATWCCSSLEEGQGGLCVATSRLLLMQSVLASVVQVGALALLLCSRILSVVARPWIVVSCCSREGEWSQGWPILPSCWHHHSSTHLGSPL